MTKVLRVTSRNARFQQWQALLSNRTKRQRAGEFLVHGVRPITLAIEHDWPIRALLYDMERSLSRWAVDILRRVDTEHVAMAPELLHELGEKTDEAPELLAVVGIPADDLSRIPVGPEFLGVVFDRPASPGNIGSLIRSIDAFGGSGMIITGHAADPYDPLSVRGSTGSVFAVPVVRASAHHAVLDWVGRVRAHGIPVAIVGTDENGAVDVADDDLTQPTLLLIGNETTGLSAGWRDACDHLVRIPITGSASSLNAANAGTVVLYEATRQRTAHRRAVTEVASAPGDRRGHSGRARP